MPTTLSAIFPVFFLIFAGWFARRFNILAHSTPGELNGFVVRFALPALLFDIVSHARWSDIWQPGFILVFGLGTAIIFSIAAIVRYRRSGDLGASAIEGLNAGYANTGFIGLPLSVALFGRQAMVPVMVATILTACLLFGVAIAMIEMARFSGQRKGRLLPKVVSSTLSNPIIFAPALGAIFNMLGARLPAPIEVPIKMLALTASPCALVALGLFIASQRTSENDSTVTKSWLIGLKLFGQPLITWVLAWLFALPHDVRQLAVMLAALPTGTGPFMLAEVHGRMAGMTSSVILTSTIASIATLSLYLAYS